MTRLAYKSSLESAKRDRQSSSERARSASERELDLFPLLEIESSDVVLARTFQGAKLSNCQLNAFLSFQRIFGNADNASKRWECFRTKPKYVENHLKIGPTHLQNIFQTLTTHLNSERTSYFLYQPRETTASYYTLFMRRFCLHFDDCRNYVDSLREDF